MTVDHPDICPLSGQVDVDGGLVAAALDAFHEGSREAWAAPFRPRGHEDYQRLCMVRALEAAFRLARGVAENPGATG